MNGEPDRVDRRRGCLSVLVALASAAAIAGWLLAFKRWYPDGGGWVGPGAWRMVLYLPAFAAVSLLTTGLLVRGLRPWDDASTFPPSSELRKWLLRGLAIGVIANALAPAALVVIGEGWIAPVPRASTVLRWAAVVSIPVSAYWEEIVFRGVVLRGLMPLGRAPAALLSALAFAGMHFLAEPIYPERLALLIAFGILLGAAYLAAGALGFPIGIHLGLNLVGFLMCHDPLGAGPWRFACALSVETFLAAAVGGVFVAIAFAIYLPRSLARLSP